MAGQVQPGITSLPDQILISNPMTALYHQLIGNPYRGRIDPDIQIFCFEIYLLRSSPVDRRIKFFIQIFRLYTNPLNSDLFNSSGQSDSSNVMITNVFLILYPFEDIDVRRTVPYQTPPW